MNFKKFLKGIEGNENVTKMSVDSKGHLDIIVFSLLRHLKITPKEVIGFLSHEGTVATGEYLKSIMSEMLEDMKKKIAEVDREISNE